MSKLSGFDTNFWLAFCLYTRRSFSQAATAFLCTASALKGFGDGGPLLSNDNWRRTILWWPGPWCPFLVSLKRLKAWIPDFLGSSPLHKLFGPRKRTPQSLFSSSLRPERSRERRIRGTGKREQQRARVPNLAAWVLTWESMQTGFRVPLRVPTSFFWSSDPARCVGNNDKPQ